MKKLILAIVILVLIMPSAVFAKGPTELEVEETTGVVLATFGLIFMTSMFGETPEGIELKMDDISSGMSIVFDNFDIDAYFSMLSENEGSGVMTDELPPITFSKITGTVSVTEDGDMNLEVKLKGGNIKTLTLRTSGEDLVELTANGKDYSYMDDILGDE
ncbi:MAG: hypothetical protein JEZ04_08545 [Spirochaetales bacterium]|nr:hypothetical protein [Spirochaetales bacterium]